MKFNKEFWLTCAFILMFLGSIVGVLLANMKRDGFIDTTTPKAPPFWQTGVIYQVYPRSLQDHDMDGVGDLSGIASRMKHFTAIGINTVWLSPIFQSPMADFGYDISNFTAIDPIFGTMEDFDALVAEAHNLGLKIVMDLVPNHSSDEHEWFQKSIRRESPYTDYYIWAPASSYNSTDHPVPPNNWLSVFGGSAWTWQKDRDEFYFHQFLAKQPDLNYRNPLVQQEMEDVISFWMDKGVDGARVDAIKHMFEVEDVSQDEAPSGDPDVLDPNEYYFLNHNLTTDQPETFEVLRKWRLLLDQYPESKVMMAEVYYDTNNMEEVMKYYGTEEEPIADFPFNFNFIELQNRSDVSGDYLKDLVNRWMDNMPEGMWPNWVLGNHDNFRISSRIGSDLSDAFNMIALLLPGTAITYYGEEIGMQDTLISYEDTQDPAGCNWGEDRYMEFSRDPARTPMQWDNSTAAGFTNGSSTWLPVNENYATLNVANQRRPDVESPIKVYQTLTALRKEEVFYSGGLAFPVVSEKIFSFVRYILEQTTYLVVVNTGSDAITVDMHHNANFELPESGEVVIRSTTDTRNVTELGSVLKLSAVPLLAGEGLVLLMLH